MRRKLILEYSHPRLTLLINSGILPSGVGAPWPVEYAGTNIAGGINPEEFNYFHELIAVDEMCRCGAAGVSASFVGLSIGTRILGQLLAAHW